MWNEADSYDYLIMFQFVFNNNDLEKIQIPYAKIKINYIINSWKHYLSLMFINSADLIGVRVI